jgi:hypothetical protein
MHHRPLSSVRSSIGTRQAQVLERHAHQLNQRSRVLETSSRNRRLPRGARELVDLCVARLAGAAGSARFETAGSIRSITTAVS